MSVLGQALRLFFLASSAFAFTHSEFTRIYRRQGLPDPTSFDWYAVQPSENITWTPCFDTHQCARLQLPLDYATPHGPKTQIALQMIPATDKANYQGTILVNPGGPGAPGTTFVLDGETKLKELFGPTFDILGFDPRGVGATTPRALCFDSPEESDAWALQEVVTVQVGDGSIPLARARDEVLSSLCAAKLGGTGREDINGSAEDWGSGRFMDTASVATDMLNIVEKLGQEKLQYYGISYGTVIGQYFAALYPHKIGRMIIDGVVDGEDWNHGGAFYTTSVSETDRVMDTFFDDCSHAGRELCAVWEKTPSRVSQRVDRILASLRDEGPVPIFADDGGPGVATEADVLSYIVQRLYSPDFDFPFLAQTLKAVESRNATALPPFAFSSNIPTVSLPPWLQRNYAPQAVHCIDFPPMDDSLREDIAIIKNATAISRWGGGFTFSRRRITCGTWKIRAKARYTGPVSAKLDVPVLVLSNRLDPVAPLSSARAVVSRFKGMHLLILNTVGHSTYESTSNCITAAVTAYMTNGTLPIAAVCQPDVRPFGLSVGP